MKKDIHLFAGGHKHTLKEKSDDNTIKFFPAFLFKRHNNSKPANTNQQRNEDGYYSIVASSKKTEKKYRK